MIEPGAIFRVRYPFVRVEVDIPDPDPEGRGFATIQSWRPGVEHASRYPDETYDCCDGEGEMVLTVVSVHRPGKFPPRVFYTRQWVDPEGKAFGKGNLHVTTQQAFRRRASRYQHEYEVRQKPVPAAAGERGQMTQENQHEF